MFVFYLSHYYTHALQVFQLGVILQPSSSEALCHLGNGQLRQHDASNESCWLTDAELSFRASMDMEGKAIKPSLIPDKLQQQKWWKEREAAKLPATSSGKQQPGIAKQPSGAVKQPPGAAKQPVKQPAKQPPGAAKQQGLARPAGRGSRVQVGAGKSAPVSITASKSVGGRSVPSKPGPARDGKSVATLGDLKSGKSKVGQSSTAAAAATTAKSSTDLPSTSEKERPGSQNEEKEEMNKSSYLPRLGLARTLARTTDAKKRGESQTLYQEVMTMNPDVHDAYIELGEILASIKPEKAVEVYSSFPFCSPPSFDDAFLHGEIIRLVMKSGKYDNPHLIPSMIAMGKALGIGVLDKQVAILEGKFKSFILKTVYAGVHDKNVDDPELEAFFKFKCWL